MHATAAARQERCGHALNRENRAEDQRAGKRHRQPISSERTVEDCREDQIQDAVFARNGNERHNNTGQRIGGNDGQADRRGLRGQLGNKIVRAATGRGPNTKTSRVSGSIESQLRTPTTPTASIVSEMSECTTLEAPINAPSANAELTNISSPFAA